MKNFCLTLLMQFSMMLGYSQITNPINIEEKAVDYFCNHVLINEPQLNKLKIYFDGVTNGKPSNVYDVAFCLGDINLFKDSIPNKIYLDSLEQEFSQRKMNVIKINNRYKQLSKRSLFRRSGYRLSLYNAIKYNGIYCVEFFLTNKEWDTYTIIVILDKNLVPLNYCVNAIAYN